MRNEPANSMTDQEAKATLLKIVAELGIGSLAATESVILTNIQNGSRRADCLSLVECYLTKEGIETDDEDDEAGIDDCPLNWGHDPTEYLANFAKQFPELKGVGTRY